MNRNKSQRGCARDELIVRGRYIFVRSTIAFLVVFAFRCDARTIDIPPDEPRAKFTAPDKWIINIEGEITRATSPDKRIDFLVVAIERSKVGETMGEVMNYIRNVAGVAVDASSARNESGKVNGHDAKFLSWKGTARGAAMEIRYAIFALAPNEGFLVAYWAPEAELRAQRAQLERMLNSIQPR